MSRVHSFTCELGFKKTNGPNSNLQTKSCFPQKGPIFSLYCTKYIFRKKVVFLWAIDRVKNPIPAFPNGNGFLPFTDAQ